MIRRRKRPYEHLILVYFLSCFASTKACNAVNPRKQHPHSHVLVRNHLQITLLIISPLRPNPGRREKNNLNFYFHTSREAGRVKQI